MVSCYYQNITKYILIINVKVGNNQYPVPSVFPDAGNYPRQVPPPTTVCLMFSPVKGGLVSWHAKSQPEIFIFLQATLLHRARQSPPVQQDEELAQHPLYQGGVKCGARW